jgi:hypothetical protein
MKHVRVRHDSACLLFRNSYEAGNVTVCKRIKILNVLSNY